MVKHRWNKNTYLELVREYAAKPVSVLGTKSSTMTYLLLSSPLPTVKPAVDKGWELQRTIAPLFGQKKVFSPMARMWSSWLNIQPGVHHGREVRVEVHRLCIHGSLEWANKNDWFCLARRKSEKTKENVPIPMCLTCAREVSLKESWRVRASYHSKRQVVRKG
jgi:hypothetical protein